MSETIIGIIIGGALGIIPTLITVFLNFFNERNRRRHDLKMEHLRIYENSRKEALERLMTCLGAMLSCELSSQFSPEKFYAAAQLAKIYVSDKTAAAINDAVKSVASVRNVAPDHLYCSGAAGLIGDEIYQRLDRMIRHELASPLPQYDAE